MPASLTEGRRIYAIGDIHGRLDLILYLGGLIARDLRDRPHPHPLIVLVGDYTDRGPDSRGVIDHLSAWAETGPEKIFLIGNHDFYFLEYLRDPHMQPGGLHWLNPRIGGERTLASYGVPGGSEHAPGATHRAFSDAVPPHHRSFLEGLPSTCRVGGYLFVHAGIRPGKTLAEQAFFDLIWIREEFLTSRADHGFTVVHGHTIVPTPQRLTNRIAIDTGAFRSGDLTCLVLEDADIGLLTGVGVLPLSPWPQA